MSHAKLTSLNTLFEFPRVIVGRRGLVIAPVLLVSLMLTPGAVVGQSGPAVTVVEVTGTIGQANFKTTNATTRTRAR